MMRHLSEHELAGFLDTELAEADRIRVEAHLEACGECRAEIRQVAQILQELPSAVTEPKRAPKPTPDHRSGSRWRLPVGLGGLAAAAVVASVLIWPGGTDLVEQPVQERSGTEGVALLAPHFPSAGGVVDRADLRFSWESHEAGSYRITLTAEDGALLWSQTLADTVAAPPTDLELPAGQSYFWYVDAIDIGVAARTGALSFTIAP
jgi:hypothetical protein